MLLDTNLPICASESGSPHHVWARETIARAVSTEGASINAVCLAEVCVGESNPSTAADRIRAWGVRIVDVPAAAAEVCARAYRLYLDRRLSQSGKDSPRVPLPDFFIGAHAQVLGWTLASADASRIRTYYPSVPLKTPD